METSSGQQRQPHPLALQITCQLQTSLLSYPEVHPEDLSFEDPEQATEVIHSDKSSYWTVVFNIVNTTIGSGVLGYPYITKQLGIIIGIFMISMGAFFTCFSSMILQKAKNASQHGSYMTIGHACFKRPGRVVANTLILVNSLGSCIVSLVIFTTVAQNLMMAFTDSCSAENGSVKFYCSTTMLTILAGLIILPLNFIKSFNRMRFVSVLKIVSIVIFTAITVGFALVRAVHGEISSTVEIWPNFSEPLAMLATVPQIMVGYDFLFNQFSLYKTMNETSDKKFKSAVFTSMTFVGFVYLSVGICGHLIYGNQTNDLLKNFNQKDLGSVWYSVLNLAFVVSSLAGIPVSYVPARTIVYQGIVKRMIERRLNNMKQENKETFCSNSDFVPSTHNRTAVYTAVVLITTIIMVILAIVVPGLNQALGLIGSVGSTGLVFVLPMSFYLILARRKRKYKRLCKFVLVFGIMSGIFGLAINTVSIISPTTIKMS